MGKTHFEYTLMLTVKMYMKLHICIITLHLYCPVLTMCINYMKVCCV